MSAPPPNAEDIAIIGMACIVPRADTPWQFWQNIVNKVDGLSDPPRDSPADRYSRPDSAVAQPIYTGRGGYLGDVSRFNPIKYGIMPAGIDGAEPDQFLALRCAHEALTDAGSPGLPLQRDKTAVILGRGVYINRGVLSVLLHGFGIDQLIGVLRQLEPDRSEGDLAIIRQELKKNLPPFTPETIPGLMHCSMTGRIANRLDLNGPAYTLDAACSSTLIAVEHGIRELRAGRCDAVLAGGVQVSTLLFVYQLFCQIDALSRTGEIAPFSAKARGTMLGEGCGILVLKRRSDAERDGHRIYALVKAVGVSSDGRGAGLLAPRTEGQQLAIRRAYEQSGISPSSIGLLEAHGTGIPVGDKTEMTSLRACFGPRVGEHATIALGSVKSMIGHLIPASGAASLIKSALALYHRTLPPTLNAEEPNPELGLEQTPFYPCTRARPWIHGNRTVPRRAGINAFGFGGINAHAILEEHPVPDERALLRFEKDWPIELVVVSAKDRKALQTRVQALASWVSRASGVPLLDVAASCAAERGPCRVAILAPSVPELIKKFTHVSELLAQPDRTRIQDRSGIFWYEEPLSQTGRMAFVFSGAGAQYPQMLTELCRHFPEVRHQFDLTDEAYLRIGAVKPLSRLIFPLPEEEAAAEADLRRPPGRMISVMTAERGLLAIMNRLGIKPQAVVGHSNGEFVAFQAAGAFDPADDKELVQSIVHGLDNDIRQGTPGLVPEIILTTVGGVPPATIDELVEASGGRLRVAIDNCPNQVVLAGDEAATAEALKRLGNKGGLCERLPVRALHTPAFAPACEVTAEFFEKVRLGSPKIELWSATSAALYPEEHEAVMELAVRQLRCKLRFRETIQAMYQAGVRLFVEVGPRGNLSAFIADTLAKQPHLVIPLDVPRKPGLEQLCRAIGMLVAHGVSVNLSALYSLRGPRLLHLQAEAFKAPAPEPPLDKSMPELVLSEAAAERLRRTRKQPGEKVTSNRSVPESVTPPHAGNGTGPPSAREVAGNKAVSPSPSTEMKAKALAEYQKTMRVFLETQENVAMAKLGRKGEPPRPPSRVSASTPLPSVQLTPSGDKHASGAGARLSLKERLLQIVSERTGYPTEMLNWEANLEADLGIDSIKRVEIIGAFRRAALPSLEEPPADFMERMTAAKTLKGIHEGVAALVESGPSNSATSVQRRKAALSVKEKQWPYLDTILLQDSDRRLVAECELDVTRHACLLDHTFFGRNLSVNDPTLSALPVTPLALMLEIMAEGAAILRPGLGVVALRTIRTMNWLAFEVPSRRVRVEATGEDGDDVRVVLYEADREGMTAALAEAIVEMKKATPELGAATLPDNSTTLYPWTDDAIYGRSQEEIYGRIVFHGPSFRGIEALEAADADAARAHVKQPHPGMLLPADADGKLLLPVGLIDQCGQIAVFGLVQNSWNEQEVLLNFPNSIERVEFDPGADRNGSLRAVARMRHDGPKLRSDVEMTTPEGRVVLRALGRVEEVVPVPAPMYAYWSAPERVQLTRSLADVVADIAGADRCSVCQTAFGDAKILVKRLWSQVLARMILSAEERRSFGNLKLPPVAAASWLLGRAAVKDAVRRQVKMPMCLADVPIVADEYGRPMAAIKAAAQGPLVSLAHKGLTAVAVAADASVFRGIGIDLEPLAALDAGIKADAFNPAERALIEQAARDIDEPADHWHLSAWAAKEAVGKALGRGVIGGPRSIETMAIDPATGMLTMMLRGTMAATFPDYAGQRLDVYRRLHEQQVLALCLLRSAKGDEKRK
jgi:acyl transferase domain-containing protein